MSFIIYSRDNCTYCEQSKNLLSQKGLVFEEMKIGQDISRDDFFLLYQERDLPLPRTVPQIFFEDESGVTYVGGFDQLKKYLLDKTI